MNPFDTRRAATTRASLALGALLVAGALAGCGAGQISQTATQEPAVNGTSGTVANLALRNVHVQAVETVDAVQPGKSVPLILSVSNQSPDTPDKLVSITSNVGSVSLTGDTTVPAGGVLAVGTPDGVTALSQVEAADAVEAAVALNTPIRNGLTYAFTFNFEKAGSTTLAVPISAGAAPRREAQ